MKNISTGVFERGGSDELSDRSFCAVLALSVIWGLMVTAIIAQETAAARYAPGISEFLIVGLLVPIIGVIIAVSSRNPVISFIGYNLIVVPFGMILGPVLNVYSPNVVRNAFSMTATITFIMGLAGVMFPGLFSRLGGLLFTALIGLLLIRVVQIFVPALNLVIFDYLGAGLFSLFIGFDMWRASQVPKTASNALGVAIDLYLDIINLFLLLLRILGEVDD